MRIIRKKLDSKVTTLLRALTKQLGVEDYGFTCDVFCLMRNQGNGIPTKERLDALAQAVSQAESVPVVTLRIIVNKRAQVLRNLVKTSYFMSLANSKLSGIDSTGRLLINLRKMYLKTREAQCIACPLHSNCDFGKQYGRSARNIVFAIDPNWQANVHPDCPILPQISMSNQVSLGAQSLIAQTAPSATAGAAPEVKQVAEAQKDLSEEEAPEEDDSEEAMSINDEEDPEDGPIDRDYSEPSGYGARDSYDVKLSGNSVWATNEQLIDKISKEKLILFELGAKLSLALGAAKSGAFAPVDNLAKEKDTSNIKKVSDLPKVVSSQHGLPKKLFNAKLNKKTLVKTQNLEQDMRKQLLYPLIDGSDSMNDALGAGANKLGIDSKAQLAVLLSSAFLRRVRDDGGMAFTRIFGSTPGPMHAARRKDEFQYVLDMIAMCSFSSGTNIQSAISAACKDIQGAQDEIARAEILLITDCEDSLDEKWLRAQLGKTELSVLDCTGGRSASMFSNGSTVLKSVATKYYKTNEKALNLTDLVALL